VFVIIDTIKDAGMVLAPAGFQGGPGGVVTVPALFMMRKAFLDNQMCLRLRGRDYPHRVVLILQKVSGARDDLAEPQPATAYRPSHRRGGAPDFPRQGRDENFRNRTYRFGHALGLLWHSYAGTLSRRLFTRPGENGRTLRP